MRARSADATEGDVPAAASDPELIFVVGASRSGTTMVSRLLGRHTAVLALQELHFFGRTWNPRDAGVVWSHRTAVEAAALLLARVRSGVWDARVREAEREHAGALLEPLAAEHWHPAELYRAVISDVARRAGASYVVEQTPVNVYFMPELAGLYPTARFVQLVRDPRAVLYSQRHRWRKRWRDARNMPLSEVMRGFVNYHPVTMMQLWNRACACGEGMSGHPRYLRVRYEDLVTDARARVQALCDFLGLSFEEAMLDIPRTGSSHAISKLETGFDPQLATAWRGRLSSGEVYLAEALAGRALRGAGYVACARPTWALRALWPLLLYPLHVAAVWVVNPRSAWAQSRAVFRRGA
jgi:hypothetical protein